MHSRVRSLDATRFHLQAPAFIKPLIEAIRPDRLRFAVRRLGGHLLFYGIEAARGGKPLPPSAQEWAYRAGFAVMASLFLFATWNDITRLFPGAQ